jgi:tetratricopeptide (TPR) repeat protein
LTKSGAFVKSRFPLVSLCIVALFGCAFGQTFEINNGQPSTPGKQKKQPANGDTPQSGTNFGWGSSIEVSRQVHAAQDAINKGDYAGAVTFAERAANAAPQNAELWFLLGYAARLSERYQTSIDAYNHGLKIQPNSVRGLAGLAQTYAKMGRGSEAEKLLQRVIEANPKDANNLQLAGELMLNSDPGRALDLLKRADAVQPSAHTDLLIANAYNREGNPTESTRYLERAKSRAPRDPDVVRAIAGQYRDQGKYEQAIATLEALHSKSIDVQAELADTYQLAGKQQDAANLFSRLAKSAKGNLGLDLSAAQAWVNLGRIDEANAFLGDARQIDPNSYRLHAILGQIAESQDRLADAREEYNQALQHLPPGVPEGQLYPIELRLNLYELTLRQDDQAAAKQQLDAAAAAIRSAQVSESARPELLRLRAAVEMAAGNLDAADKDLKEALALAPANLNSLLNYGSLQWKLGQKGAARDTFTKVLEVDPKNRTALSSLGYLARDKGDNKLAESYFMRAAGAHPGDYTPHLALGDLYASLGNYRAAESAYEQAYQGLQSNAMIVAGGANAALLAHNLDLAKRWLERAQGAMNDVPQVMRERERYLTLTGDYAASADLGRKVLEKMPNDRQGVVYLVYDLFYLGEYNEAMALIYKYEPQFRNDKDLALVAGYVHAHNGERMEAISDFNRALERDPNMATGYVNRGFVLKDLNQPDKAARDFQVAIKLQPDYPEAHLGLAYADLALRRSREALKQLDASRKQLGKTHAWHLARAEAFRQAQDFTHAQPEYRAALEETPNDIPTLLAYADVLYHANNLQQASAVLETAAKVSPSDPEIYALRARVHAKQGDHDATNRDVQLAEQYGSDQVNILMATGDALLTLGERGAAMQRFSRALSAPNGDRLGVRLAVAHVFGERGQYDEARRQIGLGFAEARAGAAPVAPEDILGAANVFLSIHDFDLAETYFDKARLSGADSRTVAIGMTNTYLAQGQTQKAQKELASLGPANRYRDDYDYMMASANLYRQRQDSARALAAFAQADSVAGQQQRDVTETAEYEVASEEGRQINQTVSLFPEATFGPALEDINVYTLDARLLRITNPALLPPPRHSYQDFAVSHYRLHLGNLPVISGFVGESFTAGRLLFPSVNVVQDRNTYDTFFNGGISPVLRFGSNAITFNGGLQYTVRRDTISPLFMSQNLFRQFLFVSTNSFFNWVSVHGSAVREAGPFTEQNLHSRDASASIEFVVGRPWGNTSLIAGYTARDLLYRPFPQREYFTTSSYAGLQRKFGSRITAAILAESLRSWEVFGPNYVTAQALVPGARFDLRLAKRWSVQGSALLSRGEGYHAYDNAQSQLLLSYVRPVRGTISDGAGDISVSYPIRFSVGVEQQTFYNFPGSTRTTLLPVVHLSLF